MNDPLLGGKDQRYYGCSCLDCISMLLCVVAANITVSVAACLHCLEDIIDFYSAFFMLSFTHISQSSEYWDYFC